jgi:hypothetical protein
MRRARAGGDVVAVEADVEAADLRAGALVLLDRTGQPLGDGHATGLDADQCQAVKAAVLLDDLVADPDQRASNVIG